MYSDPASPKSGRGRCSRSCPAPACVSRPLVQDCLLLLGKQVLLERDTELFPEGLELIEILLVLALVLDLGLETCVVGDGRLASGY